MAEPVDPRATRSRSRSLKRGERENGKNGHALTRSENGSERPRTAERDDWEARLRAAVEQTIRERQRRAEIRRQFAERRTAGLARRHQTKLNRIKEDTVKTNTITTVPAPRRITCRMLNRYGEQCTGEAIAPETADVRICQRHAALVLELVKVGLTQR